MFRPLWIWQPSWLHCRPTSQQSREERQIALPRLGDVEPDLDRAPHWLTTRNVNWRGRPVASRLNCLCLLPELLPAAEPVTARVADGDVWFLSCADIGDEARPNRPFVAQADLLVRFSPASVTGRARGRARRRAPGTGRVWTNKRGNARCDGHGHSSGWAAPGRVARRVPPVGPFSITCMLCRHPVTRSDAPNGSSTRPV